MAPRSSETGAVAGAYALGQPVLRTRDGERMVGRVVGSASSSVGVLYEVEFATAIEKALFAHELESAATSDIQAALSMVASSAWTELPTVGNGHESARQAFVQAQYATMLNELLAWGAPPSAECGNHSSGLYAPGDSVAIREGDAWVLGTITGVRWRGEQASYTMETMDGVQTHGEEEIATLDAARCEAVRFSLGDRVRYVVAGHELDDDYLGIVCSVQMEGAGASYALQFDDGDIFEGLQESEVASA